MRIALLGGCGNAGRAVARLARGQCRADLLILGRDGERCAAAARELEVVAGQGSVSWAVGDARDGRALATALAGQDLVVVASSTVPWTDTLADAALEAGCDWLDLNLSAPDKLRALRDRLPRILGVGRCFVTDGGVHPGVPGALARWAGTRIPARRVEVAARFDVDWSALRVAPSTAAELLDELARSDLRLLLDGKWVRGYRYTRRFDFGAPLGEAACVPMYLDELAEAQDALPGLRDLGFFVAGFGPWVDWVIMPVAALGVRVFPSARRALARFLAWGLARFSRSAGGAAVMVRAEGGGGERLALRLFHPDAYVLTAVPVAATLLQWGERRKPGLFNQAGFVEPERFVRDLAMLGLAVEETLESAGPEESGPAGSPAGTARLRSRPRSG